MAKKFARLLEGMSKARLACIRAEADAMIQEIDQAKILRTLDMKQADLAECRTTCQPRNADMEVRA
ncbi:MAG: hypothetical protein IJU37_01120 [Desulfovibrio sp.]|nr:hypothetical protein [Desulfovibrio sp.]